MTFVAPLLRWMGEAPARERRTTAAVIVAATALVTVALVPAPSERDGRGLEAGAAPAASGDPTGAAIASGGSPGPVTGASGQTDVGAAVPGAAVPGSATTITTLGTGGGSTSVPAARLTATDRGVFADAIKVGFTIANFTPAQQYGIAPGQRTDISQAIDALVDHANERGGVLGRRIEAVKVSPDLINEPDQRQKCVELTETEGVFAVIDSFAFSFETSTACVTAEHETLLVTENPGSSANVRLGFPYLVSVQKDDNRKMKDLVWAADGAGFFDPARGFERLGLLQDGCSPDVFDAPADGLEAHLRAVGVMEWTKFRTGCSNLAEVHSGATQAALRFKQDGVTHVLLAGRPGVVVAYLDAAGRADYAPAYFAGDFLNIILGGVVDDYDERFDGALGVTQTHAGEGTVGKPLSAPIQACSDILTDHAVAPIVAEPPDDIGDDTEVLALCENFLLFLQVATAAGPDLTHETWFDALAGVGDYRGATTDLARFDRRGKMTGGDTTKLVQWHRDCRCWKELTGFGPAAG